MSPSSRVRSIPSTAWTFSLLLETICEIMLCWTGKYFFRFLTSRTATLVHLQQVAGSSRPLPCLQELRILYPAPVEREGAAGVEGASLRWVRKVGRRSLD